MSQSAAPTASAGDAVCIPGGFMHVKDLNFLGSIGGSVKSASLPDNQVVSLEGVEALQGLEELRVPRNHVGEFEELLRLRALPALQHLDLTDNPVTELPGYRHFVSKYLPRLRTLDGSALVGDPPVMSGSTSPHAAAGSASSSSSSSGSPTPARNVAPSTPPQRGGVTRLDFTPRTPTPRRSLAKRSSPSSARKIAQSQSIGADAPGSEGIASIVDALLRAARESSRYKDARSFLREAFSLIVSRSLLPWQQHSLALASSVTAAKAATVAAESRVGELMSSSADTEKAIRAELLEAEARVAELSQQVEQLQSSLRESHSKNQNLEKVLAATQKPSSDSGFVQQSRELVEMVREAHKRLMTNNERLSAQLAQSEAQRVADAEHFQRQYEELRRTVAFNKHVDRLTGKVSVE